MKKKPDKKHFQTKNVDGEKWFRPFSENAKAKAAKYKHNQLVHFNPVGETDERSVKQLGLYWQACKYVANNNDDPDWSTKDHVDYQIRMALKFFDHDFIFFEEATRRVHFKLRSISFVNLEHIDACGYFKEASEIMANKVSHERLIPVDEFIETVKASCKGQRNHI